MATDLFTSKDVIHQGWFTELEKLGPRAYKVAHLAGFLLCHAFNQV